MPRSGFINALNFESPKDLASYLMYLDKNPEVYNNYFKWKKHVYYNYSRVNYIYCEMCIRLHLEAFTGIKESIVDINKMFGKKNNCKKAKMERKLGFLKYKLEEID